MTMKKTFLFFTLLLLASVICSSSCSYHNDDNPNEYPDPQPEPEPEPGPEPGNVPDWDELEANHTFQVGDHFTHDGTEYEVLRVFTKQDGWAPPALLDDYYKVVTE